MKREDYFNELATHLLKFAPNERSRRSLSDRLYSAHAHHTAGKTGIKDLLGENSSWLFKESENFQKEWVDRFSDWDINPFSSEQGGHIQDLAEEVSKVYLETYNRKSPEQKD